jgi:hypothetical protein
MRAELAGTAAGICTVLSAVDLATYAALYKNELNI